MFVPVLMELQSPCDMVGLLMPYYREHARQQGIVPSALVPPEPVLLRVSSSLDLCYMVFYAVVQTQKVIYVLQLLSTVSFFFFLLSVCSWELWAGRVYLAVFTFQPRHHEMCVGSAVFWRCVRLNILCAENGCTHVVPAFTLAIANSTALLHLGDAGV